VAAEAITGPVDDSVAVAEADEVNVRANGKPLPNFSRSIFPCVTLLDEMALSSRVADIVGCFLLFYSLLYAFHTIPL